MSESARYLSPLSLLRPRGVRVIEAFSPKLGRRLHLFGRDAFDQWIRLESNPAVLTFCERPVQLNDGANDCLVDFWARHHDREMLILIRDSSVLAETMIGDISIPICAIPRAELAAARTWIDNWERILPCLIACRQFITASLTRAAVQFISEPMQLSRIERECALGDPTLARATVFNLLHGGQLRAPQLAVTPLSYQTCFEPVRDKP